MEAAVASQSPSPAPNGVAATAFPVVDPVRVVDYLASLLEATLGATRSELEATGSLLSKAGYPDTVQRCTRFATDSQVALYIQKDLATTNGLENGTGPEGMKDVPATQCWAGIMTLTLGLQVFLSMCIPSRPTWPPPPPRWPSSSYSSDRSLSTLMFR
jgi:hypothetical protein